MTKQLEERVNQVLIGGNHLASVLIGRLGPNFPHYKASYEKVRAGLPSEDADIWVAWQQIMLLRDAMRHEGLIE